MRCESSCVPLPIQPGQQSALVYCKQCLEVRHFTPYDTAPQYRIHGEELEEEFDQDHVLFFQRHQGHSLVLLKRKKERCWADRPLWDPFRTAYEEVTDGRETFLLKSWRTDIATPRQYALLRGSLNITTNIILSEEPLQSTLIRDFPCPPEKVAGLTKLLQRTVAGLSPEELIPAYCSADDPQLSFAYLAEHHMRMLVRRCDETAIPLEKERLWDFLVRNQEEEELTIKMQQQCSLQFA